MRSLERFNRRERAFESVIAAVVIERCVAGPHLADNIEIFVGAGVAFVLGEKIAVLALFFVVAARDDMDGGAAPADLVQRRELARRKRGRRKARPMRHHQPEPFGDGGDMGRDQDAFRTGGMERHQRAIESAGLVRPRDSLDIVEIHDWPFGRINLGELPGADKTDELDRHAGGPPCTIAPSEFLHRRSFRP
jgi:hypothetical protein